MWTEVWDEVRDSVALTPLRFWLIAVFGAVLLAQTVSLRAALRERWRWRVLYQAARDGRWESVREATLPRLKLQAILAAACLLIPAGGALSASLARRTITTMLLGGHLAYDSMHAVMIHGGLDGQLGALLLASLFAAPSILLAALASGMMVGLRRRARDLQCAGTVPVTLPRPWRTALLALAAVVLGLLPLLAGVVAYVTRWFAGARAATRLSPSEQLTAFDVVLAHARRGMETGALVQIAGAITGALLVTLVLVRRKAPEPPTWRRTLLWSSVCLVVAAACLLITWPLQAENDKPWPPVQRNPCRCSCGAYLGCPPTSEQEGPDALEPGPFLKLSESSMTLDGRQLSATQELVDELITSRNNHSLLHPGEPFPGRVGLSCVPSVPATRLADALAAAERAGFRQVYFRLTTVETILRPLFGRISRLKSTAARASLEAQAPGTVVSLRRTTGATCRDVERDVVERRHAGHEVRLDGAYSTGKSGPSSAMGTP